MNNRKKSPWLVMGVLAVVLLTSLGCAFSLGAPGLLQQQPAPTNPLNNFPNNAPTASAFGTTPIPPSAQIPSTGSRDIGNLGQPVSSTPLSLEQIYNASNPGVVSILVQVNQGGQTGEGAGSGFVLSDNGFIVTNHHVIDGASTIVVRFYNDADSQAHVIGDDPNSDLAILQVDKLAEGAHPLPLGDSSQVRVGDSVAAIGNPFALGTSMSSGIISAVNRSIPSGFTPYNIPEALQTDAAINPGNSGGPLIDMKGNIIGINAQIRTASQGGGNIGIGFAIPVNILKQIYPSLIQNGSYAWPYLGVGSAARNPLALNTNNVQAQRGALISQVESGGPAARAGLQQGDVVIAADGQKISNFDDLLSFIAYKHPGDQVQLTILRGNQQQTVTVTLGQRPSGSGSSQ